MNNGEWDEKEEEEEEVDPYTCLIGFVEGSEQCEFCEWHDVCAELNEED